MSEPDVPKYVESILTDAIERNASDIYWLPAKDTVAVRYRISGTQCDMDEVHGEFALQCLTHVKVLAGLLTYRTQIAQDGVIRRTDGTELRVASMPTLHGERITIRILSREKGPRMLEDLNFPAEQLIVLKQILARPHGLIVLTGPTGCGKTTTIYALLRELLKNDQDPSSIITLEDPVENVIPGISQTAVPQGKDEWNYETALRAALRQDVKTLVVGEMRDKNIVRVVLDAALTGHRVITTYHAGDVAAVYGRLLHQGFEPFLIASAVTGVVCQRLVPAKEGGMVPVVAVLRPDDAWQEFVCEKPELGAIRKKVSDYPLGDLRSAAAALRDQEIITPETAELIED